MTHNIGSINAWTCCNAYACVPFFTHIFVPKGLGTIVVTFKPSSEACQIGSEGINHFHHIPHSGITFLTFWLLSSLIPFAIP